MTQRDLQKLSIWVEWAARPDWTVEDAAERVAQSLREIHKVWDGADVFQPSSTSKTATPVDDPGLGRSLIGGLKASRNRNLFKDTELFGDGSISPSTGGRVPLSLSFGQVAVRNSWGTGRAEINADHPLTTALTKRPEAVTALIAALGETWNARNGWLDMTHVRQTWNRWKRDLPVFGWATWLHPSFATVDTDGLDVDVTDAAGGGKLIVLQVDPLAMADSGGEVGKDVIRQLAARTVLADGRRLLEINDRLRQALQEEAPA